MSLSKSTKYHITLVLASLALLAGLVWAGVGCTDFDQWTSPTSPSAEEPAAVETPPTTKVTTQDKAILVVYEHLLSQAKSYQAKDYLADFYTVCDNWSADSELLKDGTSIWNVTVDMTGVAVWTEELYWRQATWFILEDGEVIPSTDFKANALRSEADLQELSLPSTTPVIVD
jgi:hypothetical protein